MTTIEHLRIVQEPRRCRPSDELPVIYVVVDESPIRQTQREPGLEDALTDMNIPVLLINVGHHPERYDQLRQAAELLPDARLIENPGGEDDILYWRTDLITPLIVEFVEEIESVKY